MLVYILNFFRIFAGLCDSVVVRERIGYERSGFEVRARPWVAIQGGKTFCASFCASLTAGSRRAFLCVDFVAGVLSEMHEVRTFAPCKAFLFDMFAFFSSLENYFGFRTTNVKGKTDHSVGLRWNKRF